MNVEMLQVYRRRLSAFTPPREENENERGRWRWYGGQIVDCNFVAAAPAPSKQPSRPTRPPRQLNFYNAVQRQLMAFPLLMLQL